MALQMGSCGYKILLIVAITPFIARLRTHLASVFSIFFANLRWERSFRRISSPSPRKWSLNVGGTFLGRVAGLVVAIWISKVSCEQLFKETSFFARKYPSLDLINRCVCVFFPWATPPWEVRNSFEWMFCLFPNIFEKKKCAWKKL